MLNAILNNFETSLSIVLSVNGYITLNSNLTVHDCVLITIFIKPALKREAVIVT